MVSVRNFVSDSWLTLTLLVTYCKSLSVLATSNSMPLQVVNIASQPDILQVVSIYWKSTQYIASRFHLLEVVFYYWNPICIATSKYCKSYCKLPQSVCCTYLYLFQVDKVLTKLHLKHVLHLCQTKWTAKHLSKAYNNFILSQSYLNSFQFNSVRVIGDLCPGEWSL